MTAPYPHLVPSAEPTLAGGYYRAIVVRFDTAEDRRGRTVAACLHSHRLARTAIDCAERLARRYARRGSPPSVLVPAMLTLDAEDGDPL